MISCAFTPVLAFESIIGVFFPLVCLVKSDQTLCCVINNVLSQSSKLFQLFNGFRNICKTDGWAVSANRLKELSFITGLSCSQNV